MKNRRSLAHAGSDRISHGTGSHFCSRYIKNDRYRAGRWSDRRRFSGAVGSALRRGEEITVSATAAPARIGLLGLARRRVAVEASPTVS